MSKYSHILRYWKLGLQHKSLRSLCSDAQSCLTLCDPMDCSPPGYSIHRILQARMLEWVVIPFSRGSSWPRGWTWVSCIAGRFFYCLSHQENPCKLRRAQISPIPCSVSAERVNGGSIGGWIGGWVDEQLGSQTTLGKSNKLTQLLMEIVFAVIPQRFLHSIFSSSLTRCF